MGKEGQARSDEKKTPLLVAQEQLKTQVLKSISHLSVSQVAETLNVLPSIAEDIIDPETLWTLDRVVDLAHKLGVHVVFYVKDAQKCVRWPTAICTEYLHPAEWCGTCKSPTDDDL